MTRIPQAVLQVGLKADAPCYVYDLEALASRCRRIRQLPIAEKRIFFATMANDHPEILACIRDQGFGVFVNSPQHLELALDQGFNPETIMYAASNMSDAEIQLCLETRVGLIVDSLGQLAKVGAVAKSPTDVGLRLNVGTALDRQRIQPDPDYRFGILQNELSEALAITRARGLSIKGLHSYFGTNIHDPAILLEGFARLGSLAEKLPDLDYIDVGGGFGVPDDHDGETFDLETYGRGARDILNRIQAKLNRRVELFIEPGRYLTADCGYFFVKVLDLKQRADRVFVGTNGSVVNFPRPLFHPDRAQHPITLVGRDQREQPFPLPLYICGNSTYSGDFLARNISLPLPEIGEVLVFHNAGAYGRSMITHFLGKERPLEWVVTSCQTHLHSAEEMVVSPC